MKLSSLRKTISANWHLKLMSLGLAVLSWFFITEEGIEEMQLERVPVEVVVPDGISVWNISHPHVKVKFTGQAGQLRTVRPADVKARYVVEESSPPEGLWGIDVDCKEGLYFALPAGVKVTEVDPERIRVDLVREVEDRVKVEVQFVGRLKEGFEIAEVRIVPARVSVKGPEPTLRNLRVVQTLPINCDGRSESFTERTGIENIVKGHDLEIEETVELRVRISEELDERVLKWLKIMVMKPAGLDREVSVSPDTVDITVRGQKQILAVLRPEKVTPFVHVGDKEDGTYKLPVEVNIYLEGVKVKGVLPNVDVTIGR